MGILPWASNSRWAKSAVYKIQCAWQCELKIICNASGKELLVSKLSRKCVMGASLIDKQYASRYKLANTCNVQSDDMRAQNVTQFSIQWMHCSQGLSEGATPGHKQRLQVMSRTVPPCHSERKVVWTRRSLYSLSAFNNRSILIYYTPSECYGPQWLLNY